MNAVQRFLASEWLALRVQIALGALFVAAAIPKLKEPPVFAKNVHAYAMLPDSLVNLLALALPGVEIVAGLALIAGVWRRAAALVVSGLLLVFVAGLTLNLVRGNPVACSCFDIHAAVKSCSEQLKDMFHTILRDIGMLALAAHVLWWRVRSER